MIKHLIYALTTAIAVVGVSVANAMPINFVFEGVVDLADDGNAYGLSVGDSIYGTASVEGTGVGMETFTPLDGLSVSFYVGDITFTTEQDAFFPWFPSLTLVDGDVDFLDFAAFDYDDNSFSTAFIYPLWDAVDRNGLFVSGTLDARSVPEPGALALLVAGLAGVAFMRRAGGRPQPRKQ